jgi:OmpA-OmpF porin, OOP family
LPLNRYPAKDRRLTIGGCYSRRSILETYRKLHVVAHTDNVGTLASNMHVWRRGADALATALTTNYKVGALRLTARGVGPVAPVPSSNDRGDGRAKNRRVELVEQ